MIDIDCEGRTTRQINREIARHIEGGKSEILVKNSGARHNLAVAILKTARIEFDGSVGYYCGGLGDGPHIRINGSAGWGLAECSMSGTVVVDKNAGNGAAASIRGGTVVIRGDAAARAGIAMKGGTVIIGGNTGYMTGFMMQKGTIIVCGDAGEALGDSMYEGRIFVGGKVDDLGNDAVIQDPTEDDLKEVSESLSEFDISIPSDLKKVASGRRLWTFDKKELDLWKEAL